MTRRLLSRGRLPGMARSGRPRTIADREGREGKLLVTPTLAVVALVVIVPFGYSVLFAFQELRLVEIPAMSVFDLELTVANFAGVFASTGFWEALRTTILYATLTTAGSLAAGMAVALALRRPFRGRSLVRGTVLIPYVLPVVAATTTWSALLNPQYGPVNEFGMQYLGWSEPINFLTTESIEVAGIPVPLAFSIVVLFEIWKTFPLAFLFFTARLQAVPSDLEEAARIDGASPLQAFRHLILPQLMGVLALLGVLRFIWSFQNFNDIYLLTNGGAGTEVLAVRVYNELIGRSNVGTASATGMVITVLLAVLLVVYVWLTRRGEET